MHREPLILAVSDAAREILVRVGWVACFTRLQQPNEAIAIKLLQNLQNEHSTIRGRKITVADAIIAKVSGLPAVGPIWTHKKLRLQDAIAVFQDEGQTLIVKGKGVQPSSLGELWTKLARIIQSYITCDGRKDVVRPQLNY